MTEGENIAETPAVRAEEHAWERISAASDRDNPRIERFLGLFARLPPTRN